VQLFPVVLVGVVTQDMRKAMGTCRSGQPLLETNRSLTTILSKSVQQGSSCGVQAGFTSKGRGKLGWRWVWTWFLEISNGLRELVLYEDMDFARV
jgi:hypothetical protein